MSKTLKPGQNTGKNGGIFQQVSPSGAGKPNYTTVPDGKPMPPTTKSGDAWKPVHKTPDSKR